MCGIGIIKVFVIGFFIDVIFWFGIVVKLLFGVMDVGVSFIVGDVLFLVYFVCFEKVILKLGFIWLFIGVVIF